MDPGVLVFERHTVEYVQLERKTISPSRVFQTRVEMCPGVVRDSENWGVVSTFVCRDFRLASTNSGSVDKLERT